MTTETKDLYQAFLKDLRSKTAPSHQRLEDTFLSKNIISNDVNTSNYITYLQRMYSLVKPFELSVYPMLKELVPDIESRRKSALLEKDLDILAPGIAKPELLNAFTLNDTAAAIGAMYVIEGSTLGGKFLYANINKTLHLTQENGAAYFSGYGSETGPMWNKFTDALCNYAVSAGKAEEVIQSACNTFDIFHRTLSAEVALQ